MCFPLMQLVWSGFRTEHSPFSTTRQTILMIILPLDCRNRRPRSRPVVTAWTSQTDFELRRGLLTIADSFCLCCIKIITMQTDGKETLVCYHEKKKEAGEIPELYIICILNVAVLDEKWVSDRGAIYFFFFLKADGAAVSRSWILLPARYLSWPGSLHVSMEPLWVFIIQKTCPKVNWWPLNDLLVLRWGHECLLWCYGSSLSQHNINLKANTDTGTSHTQRDSRNQTAFQDGCTIILIWNLGDVAAFARLVSPSFGLFCSIECTL